MRLTSHMGISSLKKILDKGYPAFLVQEAFQSYLHKPPCNSRNTTIPNYAQPLRFNTQFHAQHKKMEGILQKHWTILLEDLFLSPFLTTYPKVPYHRAWNIKSKLTPSK